MLIANNFDLHLKKSDHVLECILFKYQGAFRDMIQELFGCSSFWSISSNSNIKCCLFMAEIFRENHPLNCYHSCPGVAVVVFVAVLAVFVVVEIVGLVKYT